MDVPVQYFQSVIAIELAVAGALLWQMRFFDTRSPAGRHADGLPDARLRLLVAVVVGATLFGSLWALSNDGQSRAATFVTVGLALTCVPILLRVMPPLARQAAAADGDPHSGVTVVALLLYAVAVAGLIGLLNS